VNLTNTVILITTLTSFGLVGPAQAGGLDPAMPCELEIEKTASQLIFDLSLELGRKNALSTNEFAGIRASLDALESNGNSAAARSCFRQFPNQKERYGAWMQRQARDVVKRAEKRLNQVCARRTTIFIHGYKLRLDDALAKNRLAKAARLAKKLQTGLESDPMIRRCGATRDEVGELLGSYIPSILNQAALPKVGSQMSRAYFSSQATLSASIEALQSSGKGLRPVPLSLESEVGQTRLREQLTQCLAYSKAMLELGAANTSTITSEEGESQTVEAARAFCERVDDQLPELMDKFLAHNSTYHETMLQRWRRVSIKGWGMEKVFNAKGRPLAESTLGGGAITWTYRSEAGSENPCVIYRFTARGKVLGERAIACPLVSSSRPE
jgi:hypothetical protein